MSIKATGRLIGSSKSIEGPETDIPKRLSVEQTIIEQVERIRLDGIKEIYSGTTYLAIGIAMLAAILFKQLKRKRSSMGMKILSGLGALQGSYMIIHGLTLRAAGKENMKIAGKFLKNPP